MKWINCKDKMPAKEEEVLVWVRYRNGDEAFSESWLEDDGWAMGSAKDFTVTHWMRVRKPNADLERSERSGDTLQDFVGNLDSGEL